MNHVCCGWQSLRQNDLQDDEATRSEAVREATRTSCIGHMSVPPSSSAFSHTLRSGNILHEERETNEIAIVTNLRDSPTLGALMIFNREERSHGSEAVIGMKSFSPLLLLSPFELF